MLLKRIQLGLIHVGVAITLVPINSTLNRVMIKELAISATLVAIFASLPYLFSPLQVAIGSYSDKHPVFGFRRTPYILAGLLLCVLGLVISPQVAFLIAENPAMGYLAAVLAFGAWGMGYNLSSVSYLSLATEISGEHGRGKTIATMWFMMIVGIIVTAIGISRMVEPYSPEAIERAFIMVGILALVLGLVGIAGLEKRFDRADNAASENYSYREMADVILRNPVARTFFWYLLLLLAAILGQDVLLEPYGAEAFGLTVQQTTRITSLWGTAVLAAILVAGVLEGRVARRTVAQIGNFGALAGFLVILASGFLFSDSVFYAGVILLGAGTGLSTVANLAVMFELTIPGMVGLFIGAWGVSNALSRLAGSLLAGVVRDVVTRFSGNAIAGYMVVFGIEAAMLVFAIFLFSKINLSAFRQNAQIPTLDERLGMAND